MFFVFFKNGFLTAGEFYDPYITTLDDCNERYIAEKLPNRNITWTVLVSKPQCSSGLSIRINKLCINTTNGSCTNYLKVRGCM